MTIPFDKFSVDNVKQELQKIWPNFEIAAYALYDSERVYLFNHPSYLNEPQGFKILPWNEQFAGSTVILFENYPTAIHQIDQNISLNKQFSIIAHELFHAYQYLKNEKRFPNEVLGITYPLIKENMELRVKERSHLYEAVKSNSQEEMKKHLETFISIREQRKKFIGEYLSYETNIETVEGPAFFFELQTYLNSCESSFEKEIEEYSQFFLDPYKVNESTRIASCSSGLFISICIDRLYKNWKDTFFQSKLSLYDQLKEYLPMTTYRTNISCNDEMLYDSIIQKINEFRMTQIQQYLEQNPYQVTILGNFKIKSFDPMNIITSGNLQLHNHFLSIETNDNKRFFIQRPVVTFFKENFLTVEKIKFSLPEKPEIKNHCLVIEGVGEFEGNILEEEQHFEITVL